MTIESLGMIETKGFVGAVVAADAALKAANVTLQNITVLNGGLVTALLTGEVSSVTAGVDAGVASLDTMHCLVSHYVIARTDKQTDYLAQEPGCQKEVKQAQIESKTWVTEEHDLEKMNLTDLRKQALQMSVETLSPRQINMSNKRILIRAILKELSKK